MTREVLVTGATGALGRKLVGAATAAGHHVRAMSRRSHVGYTGVHWSQGDLLANTGIDAAVEGVDVVVHGATQFHDLIEKIFSIQRFSPLLCALGGVRFQPIDTRDVTSRLVELIDCEPAGRVTDIGGPAVHTHAELARMYLAARGGRRPIVEVPVPGRIVAGYRTGANLAPDNPVGTIGFADYLAEIT